MTSQADQALRLPMPNLLVLQVSRPSLEHCAWSTAGLRSATAVLRSGAGVGVAGMAVLPRLYGQLGIQR